MRAQVLAAMAIGALLGGCASPRVPFTPRHPHLERTSQRVGDWRLQRVRNPFSETIICRLRASDGTAFYQGQAVAFRFRPSWDVHDAVYRIDGGAPQRSRDDLPELLGKGTPIDRGGVSNASAGLVWIPWRKLSDANRVVIQPRPDRTPRTFHFRGLNGLHAEATAAGCAPDSRFVP